MQNSTKLKIDIQCHLEYMLEIIYSFAYPADFKISKIVRQSLQILSGQVLKLFASTGSLIRVKSVMKSQILIVMPHWMMMTQLIVMELFQKVFQDCFKLVTTVIWADDPMFFFNLTKVTQEETILEKFKTDNHGHTYPPGSHLLREINSKFQVKTLTKQPTTWRKRKQQYFPILLLAFVLN